MSKKKTPSLAKFIVDRDELLGAAKLMDQVIERRNTIPVLGCVLVEAKGQQLTLRGTDLDIEISITIEADIMSPGRFLISSRTLLGIAEAASHPITIWQDDQKEKIGDNWPNLIKASDGEFSISLNELATPEDFPAMAHRDVTGINISQKDLQRLLGLSRMCISTEEMRYYLNGVYLCFNPDTGNLRAVSTDGYRLAHIDSHIKADISPKIIGAKTVDLMLSCLKAGGNEEATISWGGDDECRFNFDIGNIKVMSKTIDGRFPDYNLVIPKAEPRYRVAISRGMASKITRLAMVLPDRGRGTTIASEINFESGKIISKTYGGQQVAIDHGGTSEEGGPTKVGFNMKYIQEFCHHLGDVTITSETADTPAHVRTEDPDAFWVLMPMRA